MNEINCSIKRDFLKNYAGCDFFFFFAMLAIFISVRTIQEIILLTKTIPIQKEYNLFNIYLNILKGQMLCM